jgi:hypothetical protein
MRRRIERRRRTMSRTADAADLADNHAVHRSRDYFFLLHSFLFLVVSAFDKVVK